MKHIEEEPINDVIVKNQKTPENSKNQKIDILNNNQNPKQDSKNINLNIKK